MWIGVVTRQSQMPSEHNCLCGKHWVKFTKICNHQIYLFCSNVNVGKPSSCPDWPQTTFSVSLASKCLLIQSTIARRPHIDAVTAIEVSAGLKKTDTGGCWSLLPVAFADLLCLIHMVWFCLRFLVSTSNIGATGYTSFVAWATSWLKIASSVSTCESGISVYSAFSTRNYSQHVALFMQIWAVTTLNNFPVETKVVGHC